MEIWKDAQYHSSVAGYDAVRNLAVEPLGKVSGCPKETRAGHSVAVDDRDGSRKHPAVASTSEGTSYARGARRSGENGRQCRKAMAQSSLRQSLEGALVDNASFRRMVAGQEMGWRSPDYRRRQCCWRKVAADALRVDSWAENQEWPRM